MDLKDGFPPLVNEEIGKSSCKKRKISRVLPDYFPLLILPNEIFLEIMQYLSVSDLAIGLWPLLNKRIRILCREFCKKVRVLEDADLDTGREVIAMASTKLTSLSLSARKDKDSDYHNSLITLALETSPNLRELYCNQSTLSEAAILTIGRSGDSLRVLHLSQYHGCPGPSCCLPFDALIPHTACLRNLTDLNLFYVPVVNGESLVKAIVKDCERLTHIRWPISLKLTDEMFAYFMGTAQGRLQALYFNGARLTSVAYRNIGRRCKKLQQLHIREAYNISAEDIAELLTSQLSFLVLQLVRSLEVGNLARALGGLSVTGTVVGLHLFGVRNLGSVDLEAIAAACPHLERLSLFLCVQVEDDGLRIVLDRCRKLEQLNVASCPRVTAKAFDVSNSVNLKVVSADERLKKDLTEIMAHCKCIWQE